MNLSPLATWLATEGAIVVVNNDVLSYAWGNKLALTGLAASMVVNALVTGLIVFKILKVFLELKASSVEQTFGSLSSTGGPKLRHIIFIIIESGMALLAIQLVRVVITSLFELQGGPTPISLIVANDFVVIIHQALNVIKDLFISTSFVLLMMFTWLGHRTNNNFGPDLHGIVLR